MKKLIILISALLVLNACNKKSSDGDSTSSDAVSDTIESAMGTANSLAAANESGTISLMSMDESVDPYAACSVSSLRSCSGANCTVNWGDCSVGTITMSGTWSEVFSSAGCASSFTNSCSLTRTTSDSTATFASGGYITTSTEAHTTYSGVSIPSTGTTISLSGGTRTITINGLHKVRKLRTGATWSDHSITGSLTVTGSKPTSNRVVSGNITVYHNRADYTVVNTFNSVTWGDSSCKFPTSGSITAALSGSLSGSKTLTFTSTCGTATLEGAAITLTNVE